MTLLLNLFSEAWVQRLGWVLIHFLWQGAVIALALAVLLRALAKASSHARCALAGIALLACVAAPAITWFALSPREGFDPVVSQLAAVRSPQSQAASPSRAVPLAQANSAVSQVTSTPWQLRLVQAANASLPYAVGFWFLGIITLSMRLTLGWMWMRRLCRSSIPVQDPYAVEMFQHLLVGMKISQPVRLLESALVEGPMLVGWLRPFILVPASLFAGMTPNQLEAVFAHELAHVRRYDYLANLMQIFAETVLFYHPAVWWISARLRQERENCCDDIALQVTTDRLVYVSALAQLEENRAMVLALSASGGSLLQRINRIAGSKERKTSAWPLWLLIVGLLFMIGLSRSRAEAGPEPDKFDFSTKISSPDVSLSEVVKGLRDQASRYAALATLEGQASFTDVSPADDYVPAKLHSWFNLNQYAFDFDPSHRPKETCLGTACAFDGTTKQELWKYGQNLKLSKTHVYSTRSLGQSNLILLPYVYFAEEERSGDDNDFILKPVDLADSARVDNFIARLSLKGSAVVLGAKTVVVEQYLAYDDYLGKQCKIRYYLDPQAGYYPVGWDVFDDSGQPFLRYRITELGWSDVKSGIRLPYPKTAIREFFWDRSPDHPVTFFDKPNMTQEIDVTSLSANQPIPEESFTIDPSRAKTIYDLDSRALIKGTFGN